MIARQRDTNKENIKEENTNEENIKEYILKILREKLVAWELHKEDTLDDIPTPSSQVFDTFNHLKNYEFLQGINSSKSIHIILDCIEEECKIYNETIIHSEFINNIAKRLKKYITDIPTIQQYGILCLSMFVQLNYTCIENKIIKDTIMGRIYDMNKKYLKIFKDILYIDGEVPYIYCNTILQYIISSCILHPLYGILKEYKNDYVLTQWRLRLIMVLDTILKNSTGHVRECIYDILNDASNEYDFKFLHSNSILNTLDDENFIKISKYIKEYIPSDTDERMKFFTNDTINALQDDTKNISYIPKDFRIVMAIECSNACNRIGDFIRSSLLQQKITQIVPYVLNIVGILGKALHEQKKSYSHMICLSGERVLSFSDVATTDNTIDITTLIHDKEYVKEYTKELVNNVSQDTYEKNFLPKQRIDSDDIQKEFIAKYPNHGLLYNLIHCAILNHLQYLQKFTIFDTLTTSIFTACIDRILLQHDEQCEYYSNISNYEGVNSIITDNNNISNNSNNNNNTTYKELTTIQRPIKIYLKRNIREQLIPWSCHLSLQEIRSKIEYNNPKRDIRSMVLFEDINNQQNFHESKNNFHIKTRFSYIFTSDMMPWWLHKLIHAEYAIQHNLLHTAFTLYKQLNMWDRVINLMVQIGYEKRAEILLRKYLPNDGIITNDDDIIVNINELFPLYDIKKELQDIDTIYSKNYNDINIIEEYNNIIIDYGINNNDIILKEYELWYLLGNLYNKKLLYIISWIKSNYKYIEPIKKQVKLQYNDKEYDKCYEYCCIITNINNVLVDIWYLAGISCIHLKRYDNGLICFTRVITLDPQHTEAWNNLGICHLQKNSYKSAFYALERSTIVKSTSINVWNNYLVCCIKLNKYIRSIYSMEKIIELYKQIDNTTLHSVNLTIIDIDRYQIIINILQRYIINERQDDIFDFIIRFINILESFHSIIHSFIIKSKNCSNELQKYQQDNSMIYIFNTDSNNNNIYKIAGYNELYKFDCYILKNLYKILYSTKQSVKSQKWYEQYIMSLFYYGYTTTTNEWIKNIDQIIVALDEFQLIYNGALDTNTTIVFFVQRLIDTVEKVSEQNTITTSIPSKEPFINDLIKLKEKLYQIRDTYDTSKYIKKESKKSTQDYILNPYQ